jgi:hypothetical protein
MKPGTVSALTAERRCHTSSNKRYAEPAKAMSWELDRTATSKTTLLK